MNMINIAGHLGADPEVRHTPSGQKVTSLRVAVNSRRSGKDETTWYRVTIWGDRFDKMLPHLKKGSAIIVFGELHKPEIYTDKEGRQQISMEITADSIRFSPFGKSNQEQAQSAGGFAQSQAASTYTSQDSSEPSYATQRQTSQHAGAGAANASSAYNNFAMEDDEPVPF